jgi:hypothetical protein
MSGSSVRILERTKCYSFLQGGRSGQKKKAKTQASSIKDHKSRDERLKISREGMQHRGVMTARWGHSRFYTSVTAFFFNPIHPKSSDRRALLIMFQLRKFTILVVRSIQSGQKTFACFNQNFL